MSKELDALKKVKYNSNKEVVEAFDIIEKGLQRLEAIDNANPSEAIKFLEELEQNIESRVILDEYRQLKLCAVIKQALIKTQDQENENELLKEIIKSLFDKGCPLHQYIDTKFGLTIEVDNECSIMHLGEYKGVNLDKKLEEILKDKSE